MKHRTTGRRWVVAGLVAIGSVTALTVTTAGAAPAGGSPGGAAPASVPAPSAPPVLTGAGIGVARFGTPAAGVLRTMTARYGRPDADSGWRPAASHFVGCPGEVVRRVRWGQLSVWFSDGPTGYAERGRHFFAYSVERTDEPGGGLAPSTREGIGVGQTLGDLRATYGRRLAVTPGEDEAPAAFQVLLRGSPGHPVSGRLTGTDDTDVITLVEAGQVCAG